MTVGHGDLWRLEPHLCGDCMGRVVSAKPAAGPRVYRCTNCTRPESDSVLSSGGFRHPGICCCNSRIGTRDAGIRCVRNENPRPEMPGEFICREIG